MGTRRRGVSRGSIVGVGYFPLLSEDQGSTEVAKLGNRLYICYLYLGVLYIWV